MHSLYHKYLFLWFRSYEHPQRSKVHISLPLISDLIKISPAVIILMRQLPFKTFSNSCNVILQLIYSLMRVRTNMVLQLFVRTSNLKSHQNLYQWFLRWNIQTQFPLCVFSLCMSCNWHTIIHLGWMQILYTEWSEVQQTLRDCWRDNLKREM
jgi:prepilin signal peptidase PulO-like enzyme (type II secretory pathway)